MDLDTPQVVAQWGNPIPGIVKHEPVPLETEVTTGQKYEFVHTIEEKKPVTPAQASLILGHFVTKWRNEHPNYELKYVTLESGSPKMIRMQFIAHASPIALATIAFWAAVAIIAAVVAVVIYYAWKIISTVAYALISFPGYVAKYPLKGGLIIGGAVVVVYVAYKIATRKRAK